MRNRWFHKPLFHVSSSHEKKVTWLELFYDLIFVAAFIQLGNALSADISIKNFLAFCGVFTTLWLSWTGFTFYANRYDVDDFVHRIIVFLQMFAVGAKVITAPEVLSNEPYLFALSYSFSQAMIALLYFRSLKQQQTGRPYAVYWALVFSFGSLCWLVSVFLPIKFMYILWAVGIGGVLISPFNKISRTITDQYPIDWEHLSERYGLLTIIVIGESFVKVLSSLIHASDNIVVLIQAATILLVTGAIWWIYFDDVAGSHIKEDSFSPLIWLYSHLPLHIALTVVGVSLKKAMFFDLSIPAPIKYSLLFCFSLGLAFLSVAIIDSVTQRKHSELNDSYRLYTRLISTILVFILMASSTTMTALWFLIIIVSICVIQVFFDMIMAPFEEAPDTVDAISTSELAQKYADKKEERRHVDVGNAIRKGLPSEFRKDFYFYLMEGSWARFFIFSLSLYSLINLIFAGLYLLKPGSISYPNQIESFANAFFFSIQTISTIGYGTLSPITSYGNTIVTIQSAAGILFVALLTGLMFAKASRPKASIVFSNRLIITTRNKEKELMLRVGNARGNDIIEANINLSILVDEISEEGHHLRKVYDLALERHTTPFFSLSWTVIHKIDKNSPLYKVDLNSKNSPIIAILATLTGHDGTYGQTIYARNTYYLDDIRENVRFKDVLSQLPDGRIMIDFEKFHQIVPL